MLHQKLSRLVIALFVLNAISFSQKIEITGKVVNKDNIPQIGVIATLKGFNISDTTGSDGIYNLSRIETAIQKDLTRSDFFPTKYDGAALNFSVKQPIQDVSLDIYNLSGTKIANVLRGNLGQGNYSLAPFSYCAINLSAQLYIVRLKIGNEVSSHRAQNIWQRTHSSLSYTPLSVQALAKQSLVSDTVIYVKDGQVITTTGISKYIDTLKDLFIIQRDIFGNLLSKPQSFSEVRAVISGNSAFDSTRKAAGLWYNEPNQSFSGFVYFVYSVQVQNYSVLVDVYNKGGALIGRSEKVNFPSTAGNINIPAFNPNNAVPVIEAGIDAFVSINDTIRLHPVAIDSFGGSIKKWEWSINGGTFVQTLTGDTAFIAPADSNPFYKCRVKVTDNEGNFAFDSMNIVIFKDTPKANAGKDTTVVHIANDTVRLHGSATQQFGIIKKWEWDFGGKGVFVRVSRADTNILFPNNGGLPYLCILRVTDDDGNISSPDTMQAGFSPIIWKSVNKPVQLNPLAIGNDGTIYASSSQPMSEVFAVDRSGKQKWSIINIGGFPVVGNDGSIFINTFKNFANPAQVTAINADSTLKWKYTVENGTSSTYSSPSAIGTDGTIYFGCNNGNVYAINPDGSKKWRFVSGGASNFGNPAIGIDGTIFIGSGDNYFYAINPDSTLKWKYSAPGSFFPSAPAIGRDGTIYVTNTDASLYAINSNGTLKWNFPKLSKTYLYSLSAVTGLDGTIYIGGDSTLYAINPDGTQKWRFSTSGSLQNYSPAVGSDGTIYITSSNKQLYAVNPNGIQKWNVEITSAGLNLVIGNDGILYGAGSSGEIYAIASAGTGPAASSWPLIGRDAKHTGRMR